PHTSLVFRGMWNTTALSSCPSTHPILNGQPSSSAAPYGVPEVNVQVLMFWMAVPPPVPPVNPTYAVFAPTVDGILMVKAWVKVLLVTVSVRLSVNVVPL